MRVTFLGTGTSHGVPVIGCGCPVCTSSDPRNRRLRPSVWLRAGATSVLIDATPDFRSQALRGGIAGLDAVLLTHAHADHVLGLDEMRVFTERNQRPMPILGARETLADVTRIFPYACQDKPTWPSVPRFELQPLTTAAPFAVGELAGRAVALPHGRVTVFGFVFGQAFAYCSDCSAVPEPVIESLRHVRVLVLDGLRHRPHPTHLTVQQARHFAERIGAELTLLTHICHDLDHAATEAELPPGIRLAYDGLELDVTDTGYALVR